MVPSTHRELPQDTVKKEKAKEKHQYFIKLLSAAGPDQSLHSHSPTGRDGSFVSTPQVEQRVRVGPSISLFYPSETEGGGHVGVGTCSKNVHRLNFLTSQFEGFWGFFLSGW